jgi:hypothetical protein
MGSAQPFVDVVRRGHRCGHGGRDHPRGKRSWRTGAANLRTPRGDLGGCPCRMASPPPGRPQGTEHGAWACGNIARSRMIAQRFLRRTVQRGDHMQATGDRRICFGSLRQPTLQRQVALMRGRDAYGRGDLRLSTSSAMSVGGSPQVRCVPSTVSLLRAEEAVPLASRLPTAAVRRPRRSRSMVNASRGKS